MRAFGSAARLDDTYTSDIDLLVTPGPKTSLLDLSGFLLEVKDLTGRDVDVVSDRTVPEGSEILRDALTLGRFKPLENQGPDITLEQDEDFDVSRAEEKAIRNLDKTLKAMRSSLDKGKKLVEVGKRRFDEDWMAQDAAINTVTQLADGANRLPSSFHEERDDVPWHQLIAMRNIATHEYADVDFSTVGTVLRDNFPSVERSIFPDD